MRELQNGLQKEIKAFCREEDGIGVIEVVLILVGNCTAGLVRVLCV